MLTDDAFARLVAEDVKNKSSVEQKNYLRGPETRDRWKRALYALIENLDLQIQEIDRSEKNDSNRYEKMGKAGERLLFETVQSYDDRRKKIERFRFYVEQRIAEVDRLIALGDEDVTTEQSMTAFLQQAISTHKEMMDDHDLEPTIVDEALWAALEGKWVFGDIEDSDIE